MNTCDIKITVEGKNNETVLDYVLLHIMALTFLSTAGVYTEGNVFLFKGWNLKFSIF